MFNSEQVNELFSALSKAQGEFKAIPFDKVNPHYKSKYASLSATLDSVRPHLKNNGLSVIQSVGSDENGYHLCTRLVHSSGQFIASTLKLMVGRNDMQGLGSAITYAKRYALQAMLGIAGDEDDDGNAAADSVKKNQSSQKNEQQRPKTEPKDVVLKVGSKNDGKKLGELDAQTLDALLKWCKSKMNENPKPKNIKYIQFIYGSAKKVMEGIEPKNPDPSPQSMPQTENESQENYNPFDDFNEPLKNHAPIDNDENDLGNYVIKLKEVKELDGVFGRKLKDFEPQALQDIVLVLDHKLQEIPKVKNSTDIFIVKTKIKEYLNTF